MERWIRLPPRRPRRMGVRQAGLGLALLASVGARQLRAQADRELAAVAERARLAFLEHRFDQLLAQAALVRLRLPSQLGGAPIRRDVAVAALRAFARDAVEVGVSVLGAAAVGPSQGYVELRRRFRLDGVGEDQEQRVLLSVRRGDGGDWRVAEVWISP